MCKTTNMFTTSLFSRYVLTIGNTDQVVSLVYQTLSVVVIKLHYWRQFLWAIFWRQFLLAIFWHQFLLAKILL
jgi:hypothetical protein